MSAKPFSKNLDHHLSDEAKRRRESPLKGGFKYYGIPDLVFLGGGLPLPDYFPWNKVTVESPAPSFDNGVGYLPKTEAEKTITEIYKDPKLLKTENTDIPLSRALQYGHTDGQQELVSFLKAHTELVHLIQYQDWEIIVNTGNTQSWDNVLRTFCNKGDVILVEEHTFSSSLEAAAAQGVITFPVPMDSFGLVPEALEKILDNWVGDNNKPRLLYTIPTGQNPTGSCLSNERREAIYKLASKHDFVIVEDEPYYFLQMEQYIKDVAARAGRAVHDHAEFTKALIKSFLSIDTEGRVLRLDSFSKTLAPGARIGWITGRANFIERFTRLQEVSAQNASGFSQAIVAGTLNRWGQSGYLDWLIKLRVEYTHKRDVTADTIYQQFPLEIIEFYPPVAGMFFTFKIDATKHPKFATEFNSDPLKVEKAIFDRSVEYGAFMIPGSWFIANGQTNPPQKVEAKAKDNTVFFRGTYAATPLDVLVTGIERYGKALKDEFGLN